MLSGAFVVSADSVGIVEGTAECGPISAELPLPGEGELDAAGADVDANSDTRLIVRQAGLPALLWQQPAVRVAVQSAAGAIAVTLGMRLLRAWLAHPRAAGRVASSVLPAFADLLQAPNMAEADLARRERDGEVVETVVFMRWVVRRR
jgi:hypothetical protein